MTRPRAIRAASCVLGAFAALALAGCGLFGSPDEAAEIKTTLTAIFTRDDPATCTDLVTGNFLGATYGANREAAVSACLHSQKAGGNTAQRVDFAALRIDGGRATATLRVVGGQLNGQTVIAGLLRQYGWRLDSLRPAEPPPTPKQLRKTAYKALRKGLIESQGFKPKRADCFVHYLKRHASDAELAADLKTLHDGQTPPRFAAAAQRCE